MYCARFVCYVTYVFKNILKNVMNDIKKINLQRTNIFNIKVLVNLFKLNITFI